MLNQVKKTTPYQGPSLLKGKNAQIENFEGLG